MNVTRGVIALGAFAGGYLTVGVLMQFIVWSPAEDGGMTFRWGLEQETLIALAFFVIVASASFLAGLWLRGRLSRHAVQPDAVRAAIAGGISLLAIAALAWATQEPPPPMVVNDLPGGPGSMTMTHADWVAPSTGERVASLLLLLGLPAALGFGVVSRVARTTD